MTKLRKPKKPLSAYNIFFQEQREKMLCFDDFRRGGEGYANMARFIASKWGELDTKARSHYAKRAKEEKKRHMQELAAWKRAKKFQRSNSTSSVSSSSSSSYPTSSQEGSSLEIPSDIVASSKTTIPSDVMNDIDQWANAFGGTEDCADENNENAPVVPDMSTSSIQRRDTHRNNADTLDTSTELSLMEKHIIDTIDDLKPSVDDDFVSFMSSFFD